MKRLWLGRDQDVALPDRSSNVLVRRATTWKAVASLVSGLDIVRPSAAP
jgi:hypothetical protein